MNTIGSNTFYGFMLALVSMPFMTRSWSSVTLDHFILAWIAITFLFWVVRSWIRSAS